MVVWFWKGGFGFFVVAVLVWGFDVLGRVVFVFVFFFPELILVLFYFIKENKLRFIQLFVYNNSGFYLCFSPYNFYWIYMNLVM